MKAFAIDKGVPPPVTYHTSDTYPTTLRQIGERYEGGIIVAMKRKRRYVKYTIARPN